MRGGNSAAELATASARAIDRLGQNDFYDRLLDLLGTTAGHDLAALVRYARSSPPDLIIPRIEPTELMMAYYSHFYPFDPFYQHWKGGGSIGVYRLRAMAANIGRSRYARVFLSAMNIHDEIAVFLPPIGEAAPTLILDRAGRPFTDTELMRARNLFPLLAALHRRHIDVFVTTGIDLNTSPFGHERPLRLMDQHGATVFATRAWSSIVERADRGFAGALAALEARGPCIIKLPGARLLRRTRLPPDFGPAPGGICDEITPDAVEPAPENGLPDSLAGRLTEREREVAVLTLRGHPTIEIARKLGLSRGTVKNYRLSIYRKLDITTERELFGEYMTALRGENPGAGWPGAAGI
jgi:DNA-binding CsgD family transcriptional regulator